MKCIWFVASEELGIAGRKLVLEENGTGIADDGALLMWCREHRVLLLLCDGERYEPAQGN